MSNVQLAVQFFFQIGLILIVCQAVGVLARRAGQPQVVAEMIAGVLLGPSLLGFMWPDASARLFPAESMKVLFPASQLGLAAYMFGLHAVFGAFVMGIGMPRGVVSRQLIEKIQPLTVALLLPLFFTYSGLNTRIGLLDTAYLWMMVGLVLVAAVVGKGVACWLAARATGVSNRDAMGIGTLMNARGLMELIIINIGLQRGVISDALFATLVIMAVVTTLMASPIFEWLMGGQRPEPEPEPVNAAFSRSGDARPPLVESA